MTDGQVKRFAAAMLAVLGTALAVAIVFYGPSLELGGAVGVFIIRLTGLLR